VIYYANSFNLEHRAQSEDRSHRAGQDQKVLYIDVVARDTVDLKVLKALRAKINMSAAITKDNWREWVI
jgi:SNF2 family DNA or RNA helicase